MEALSTCTSQLDELFISVTHPKEGHLCANTQEGYKQGWCCSFSHLCCSSSNQNMRAVDRHPVQITLNPIKITFQKAHLALNTFSNKFNMLATSNMALNITKDLIYVPCVLSNMIKIRTIFHQSCIISNYFLSHLFLVPSQELSTSISLEDNKSRLTWSTNS